MRLLLGVYRRLPVLGRRWVVRTIAPSFTVGAMAIIERPDGAVLLVRHSYRKRWGVPGGLMKRREHPEVGLRREVQEEVGVEVTTTPLTPERVLALVDAASRRTRVSSGCATRSAGS